METYTFLLDCNWNLNYYFTVACLVVFKNSFTNKYLKAVCILKGRREFGLYSHF
jgi:hypothetical protein